MIPIVSLLLKMLGEIYACISLTVGVGGGIAALFGGYLGYQITRFIPGFGLPQSLLQEILPRGGGGFLSVILFAAGGAIAALLWLFLFYMASEMLVAVVDIARNTRALRRVAERFTPTERNSQ